MSNKDVAIDAIKALDAAGAVGFISCESGPKSRPKVVARFKSLYDAQAFYRALTQCGEAARELKSEECSS